MVDPNKLAAFDSRLAAIKSSTDAAAASNQAAVEAANDARTKSGVADVDLGKLQADLDAANAAAADIGLAVRAPAAPAPVEVPADAPAAN